MQSTALRRVGQATGVSTSRMAQIAPISMGSPRAVPVPCISRPPRSDAEIPASCRAALMTSCWLGPFGAVRPLERPSYVKKASCNMIVQNNTKKQMTTTETGTFKLSIA